MRMKMFRLILLSSQGTRYENMVHEMSDIEVMATHDFVDTMKRNGKSIKSVDPMLEHMLVSGMFSAFFELLIHKDDIKEAKTYLKQHFIRQVGQRYSRCRWKADNIAFHYFSTLV